MTYLIVINLLTAAAAVGIVEASIIDCNVCSTIELATTTAAAAIDGSR